MVSFSGVSDGPLSAPSRARSSQGRRGRVRSASQPHGKGQAARREARWVGATNPIKLIPFRWTTKVFWYRFGRLAWIRIDVTLLIAILFCDSDWLVTVDFVWEKKLILGEFESVMEAYGSVWVYWCLMEAYRYIRMHGRCIYTIYRARYKWPKHETLNYILVCYHIWWGYMM